MKTAKLISAGSAALAILGSAALAQQAPTGTITEVNRIDGSIGIRQPQDGTVGANTAAPTERYKVQGVSLDDFHAGDKVTYSVTDNGGTKTITKLQKQP